MEGVYNASWLRRWVVKARWQVGGRLQAARQPAKEKESVQHATQTENHPKQNKRKNAMPMSHAFSFSKQMENANQHKRTHME